MRNLLKFLSLFLIAIVGLSTSCLKHDTTPPKPVRVTVPQELLDYCYFKKGTYWIYQDSATKVIDSVYVINNSFKTDSLFQNSKCIAVVDNVDVEVRSSYEQYDYDYYYEGKNAYTCIQTNPNGTSCHFFTVEKYTTGDYIGGRTYFLYPAKIGTIMYNVDNSKTTLISYSGNKIINGVNYSGVYLSNTYKDVLQKYWTMNYYIAKNFGIVRKESLTTKQVWNLIRYKIIQ